MFLPETLQKKTLRLFGTGLQVTATVLTQSFFHFSNYLLKTSRISTPVVCDYCTMTIYPGASDRDVRDGI